MIAFLEGKLIEALPTQAIIDVNGVGCRVFIPLSTYDRLPRAGERVKLLTHLHVREDILALYGFSGVEERDLFSLLIQQVSGIGPKLALAVLSGMEVGRFKAAVVEGDTAAISKISGVGKKTAERIALELKDKVGAAAAWQAASDAIGADQAQASDAVLALLALGYKQVEAHKAVQKVMKQGKEPLEPDELVRQALKHLA